MKYAFIEAEKANLPIVHLCKALRVSRTAFYDWRKSEKRPPSRRARENESLTREIIALHQASRGCYGRPRLQLALRRKGICIGANRLRRIMLQSGICGRKRRSYRRYATSPETPPAPNLLNRNFTAAKPNQVWCGDITQFRIGTGWVYVAVIIDLFSRRVVGLSLGPDASTTLTVRAMLDALRRRRPPHGLVFHSDRGCQYYSDRYRRLLDGRGIVQSMSRRGNCLDNAVAESFFATLEMELAGRCAWASASQAEIEIRNYVFTFFNRERMHSSTEYLSPAEFEERNAA